MHPKITTIEFINICFQILMYYDFPKRIWRAVAKTKRM